MQIWAQICLAPNLERFDAPRFDTWATGGAPGDPGTTVVPRGP
jgi:hypothetical protein